MLVRVFLLLLSAGLLAGGYIVLHPPEPLKAHVAPLRDRLLPYAQSVGLIEKSDVAPAAKGIPAAPVRVAKAGRKTVPIRLEGVGTVQARSTVSVKSRVDGQLFEVAIREGQPVSKGDLLFRLDPRPFEAQLRQAEANLARDIANLEKAQSDVDRFRELSRKGISPALRLEEADTLVRTLTATIAASQAAIELAKLNLSYATIYSPISGRVGNILIAAGNMVKANDTQAMIVITETKPIYVAFAVPEQHLPAIKTRMAQSELTVQVLAQGSTKPPKTGKLFFINNVVDVATGTIQLLAEVANEDEELVPGQFIRAVALLDELKDAVVVPARAVQINQRGHYVYITRPDNTVELRPITVGPEIDDLIVVEKGIEGTENIVTDGQLRLFPGARIAPAGGQKGKNGNGGEKAKSKVQS